MRSVRFRECIIWCFLGILITPDIWESDLRDESTILVFFWGKNVIFKNQSWDQNSSQSLEKSLPFVKVPSAWTSSGWIFLPQSDGDRTDSLR